MNERRVGAYVGIDPTAPSLHVGHLVPLMALFWMYVHGFHSVTLVRIHQNLASLRWNLITVGWWGDSQHRGSYRADERSRSDVVACQEGKHGHHALPIEVHLGEC